MKKDLKTTITGLLKAGAILAGLAGITISPENQKAIVEGVMAFYAILTALHGYFARDRQD